MTALNKKELVEKFLESTPKDIELYVQHALDFAYQVSSYLKKNNLTQKDLAKLLGKEESEISKWLSGDHNFTLRSIAKIEAALDKQLIFTREEIIERFLPFIFSRKKFSHSEKSKIDELITYYSYKKDINDPLSFSFSSGAKYELKSSSGSFTELKNTTNEFEATHNNEFSQITVSYNNYTTELAA